MLLVSSCNLIKTSTLPINNFLPIQKKREGNFCNKDPVITNDNMEVQDFSINPPESYYSQTNLLNFNPENLVAQSTNHQTTNKEYDEPLPENPSIKVKSSLSTAINYLKSRDYDKAITALNDILDYSVNNNLKKTEFKVLELLARAYDKTKSFNKSLDCYLKAFDQFKDNLNVNKKAEMANNIASIYADMKNYDLSINWYKKAFNYAYTVNDSEAMDIILDDMAIAKRHQLIFENLS